MKKIVLDIEVYPNYFLLGIKNLENEEGFIFEISEYQNDLDKLFLYLSNYKDYVITFNGIHYDQPILGYICYHYKELIKLNSLEICKKIKAFSDKIILEDVFLEFKYKYYFDWFSIDIFLYWSDMLRKSKKISLKGLGIQIGYPVVQELPYDPDTYLTKEQIQEVKDYNYIHDLGILKKLIDHPIKWQGKPTTLRESILFRVDLLNKNKLNKYVLSWDEPKIASKLLLQAYSQIKGVSEKELEQSEKGYLGGVPLPLDTIDFELPVFQQTYIEMQNASRNFSKETIFNHQNTSLKISVGIGGIHSIQENEIFVSDDYNTIYTSDVSSLYPNLICNYKTIRQPEVLQKYQDVKAERMVAKKTKNKGLDAKLKLILNSTSGLLDNTHSWLYYPEGAMKMRLMGQLILLKVIEKLSINNIRVISVNTDGIEYIVPKNKEDFCTGLIDEIGKQLNYEFEHDIYSKIVYSNVNNYVAISKDGSIKQKGSLFITEPNLGDSCDELIISKALVEYFTKGISVEDFIKDPKHHIFDFCLSKKVAKKYKVYWNNKKQQRLNRFYVSKKGAFLYKTENDKTMLNMLKGYGVQIYNNHVEKPIVEYDIDYDYYISIAKKWINIIQRNNQSQLF